MPDNIRKRPFALIFAISLIVYLGSVSINSTGQTSTNLAEGRAVKPRSVSLNGEINRGSVADAVRQLGSTGASELVVTSGGGQMDDAISLAKYLNDHKLKLVINRYCVSACAHGLFILTENRYVNSDSIVGFSDNIVVYVIFKRKRGIYIDDAELNNANTILRAYKTIGVDTKLLWIPFAMMEPRCYSIDAPAKAGVARVRYKFWVPTEEQIRNFGVVGPLGNWPRSNESVGSGFEALARDNPSLLKSHLAFGGDILPNAARLDSLSSCAADDR